MGWAGGGDSGFYPWGTGHVACHLRRRNTFGLALRSVGAAGGEAGGLRPTQEQATEVRPRICTGMVLRCTCPLTTRYSALLAQPIPIIGLVAITPLHKWVSRTSLRNLLVEFDLRNEPVRHRGETRRRTVLSYPANHFLTLETQVLGE